MKNINTLREETVTLIQQGLDRDLQPGQRNKLKSKAQFLKTCIAYLETEPKEDFITKEIQRLENRVNKIMSCYRGWATDKVFDSEENRERGYAAEMGIPKIKEQIKTLNFLLA